MDGRMDACMHVCICVRVLDPAVPWHTQSPASHRGVLCSVLWAEESCFTCDSGHFWALDNPHAVRISGYQRFFW
jgi:hypothetical protein